MLHASPSNASPLWSLNEAEVAAKVIDGEAIILHLTTGLYFSLTGTACDIWEMLMSGLHAEQVAERLKSAHPDARDEVDADVARLVGQLVDEQLIITSDTDGAATSANGATATLSAAYTTPELSRYEDMADLLALDPPMPGLLDGPWVDATQAK